MSSVASANPEPGLSESDPAESPAAAPDISAERAPSGVLWLPILLGIVCTAAIVAALFGLTLLAIHIHG